MLKLSLTISVVCLFNLFGVMSQDIPLGEWRTHFSYSEGQSVEKVGNKIFTVASGSLFSYDMEDNSIRTYSKKDGLNDIEINLIRYSKTYNTLLICYVNGNIDLLKDDDIWNIAGLKMKSTAGNKRINEVCFKDEYAYLASDLGIIVLNIDRREIKETYLLASGGALNAVFDVAFYNGFIYAATNKGLFKAEEDEPILMNFANWSYDTDVPEYNKKYRFVKNFGDRLIAVRSESATTLAIVYALVSDIWQEKGRGSFLSSVRADSELLTLSYRTAFVVYDKNFKVKNIVYTMNSPDGEELAINANDGVRLDSTTFAIANLEYGLVIVSVSGETIIQAPDGPSSNTVWDIDISEAGVRVIPGAVGGDWNNTGTPPAVSTLKNGIWSFFNSKQISEFVGKRDFIDIQSDPLDPEHYFVASFGSGLFEFQGNELLKIHSTSNSPIEDIFNGNGYMRINSLAFDANNTLWLSNAQVSTNVHLLASDGSWSSLKYPEIDNVGQAVFAFGRMLISKDNTKWLLLPKRQGIFVFNEEMGEKVWLKSLIDGEKGDLISNLPISIVEDQDGSIWVGTTNGIAIYYSPEQVFENKSYFPASRIKLPREDEEEDENLADYLLNGEPISALAVDGGNRKWIGTASSGLFLVSPDGLQIIHQFTIDNSLLPSNKIRQIAIEPNTGEVFIASSKGLVSFRSDATGGSETFDKISVFPNPVREDFNGTISISGLVPQTSVKITDISGNLVYETISNGGTAAWDAKNFYGERVGTGVYMVFCSSQDGSLSEMTKILVINNK